MRTALDDSGSPIEAQAGSPDQAVCPHCGGVVILRQRRLSFPPGSVIYFWRHQDHANRDCPARFTASARKSGGKGY